LSKQRQWLPYVLAYCVINHKLQAYSY
jgi:hypothetical protein